MLFFIFLKQELKNNFKNLGLFVQNLLFFAISCAIFLIISQNSAQNGQNLLNIITISLIFSLIFANSVFLQEDFRDGTLEQMLIYLPNLEVYIVAKIVAAWVVYILPILCSILPIMWLFGQNNHHSVEIFALFGIFSICDSFVCALCASLGLSANKAPLLAVFAMPLLVPILLIAVAGFDVGNFGFAAKLLAAFALFYATLAAFAIARIVRIVI